MKKTIVFIVSISLLYSPCAASEKTPKWFGWAMRGVVAGVGALYLAQDSHHWRRSAIDDGLEGDRIFLTQENKYGLSYQERADDLWNRRGHLLRHAQHMKQVAVILSAVSVSCLGVSFTYGIRGFSVNKSIRFGGS